MSSKKARERAHEEEKAKRALQGAVMLSSTGGGGEGGGDDGTASPGEPVPLSDSSSVPRDYIDLQWFKLLRGTARMNQIATILVELAPMKVFDPSDVWAQHQKAVLKAVDTKKKHVSKKEQIQAANTARLHREAVKRDEEKLATLRSKARADVKLETELGKLLLLLEILKTVVREQNVVDALDTMWEVEEVIRELGEEDEEVRAALKKHSDVITLAKNMRLDRVFLNKMNLVDFQLTEMSDRLPPLNLHALSGKFKLDPWQVSVIEKIEAKKSVLITAPTSSGKTVLSTYVCRAGGRVLFVVPTEPLAWQVAAMLRALKLGVCLVVPTLTFTPLQWDVVIGTPHALESVLTKQLGFEFNWAVFDEVHSLNNRDGESLQRLIAAMPLKKCRFLALSATIGNAPELKRWMETFAEDVELVQHESRFINLQRHIWTHHDATTTAAESAATSDEPPLLMLHPMALITPEFLASDEFTRSDMALTPVDSYRLWQALEKHVDRNEDCKDFDVSFLKPRKYFGNDPEKRLTLAEAHQYEKALKKRLAELAREKPEVCRRVLAALSSGEKLKKTKKKTSTAAAGAGGTDDNTNNDQADSNAAAAAAATTTGVDSSRIEHILDASSKVDSVSSLVDLLFHLQASKYLPAITFQLDSVRCQFLFDGMLKEMEAREEKKHPEFRSNLLKQQRGLEKIEKKLTKSAGAERKKEEGEAPAEMVAQEFGEVSASAIDVDAPHPEFTLAPPGKGIGLSEATDIRNLLRDDLPSHGELAHPLIRALRRGVGVYVEGLPSSYHRVVQSLAQRGALGVVFSDELLGYGVNMPFRAAVFFGDPGAHWFTPLLHQQMAGRAGRRGLDRQGHLVYAGFTPDRLRELLRGALPDVVGRFPLYPTIPLQMYMNTKRYQVAGQKLDEERMRAICRKPLAEFLKGEDFPVDYYDVAKAWIVRLGLLSHPRTSYSEFLPELVWELRNYVAESVAIDFVIEYIIKKYRNQEIVKGDRDTQAQWGVMLVFSRICAREVFNPDLVKDMPSWYGALPSPHPKDAEWDEWTAILDQSQKRITECNMPWAEQLLLDPKGTMGEIDNMCYASFVRNQIDPSLPTPVQHHLRQRLWTVGEVLRITCNILGRSAEIAPSVNIIRKTFLRIRYILDETFERSFKA